MPYIPKKDRQDWMTLSEVITRISKVDECEKNVALVQLRTALMDREISARFAHEEYVIKGGLWPMPPLGPLASDSAPTDPLFWFGALFILSGDGFVIDQPILGSDQDEDASLPQRRRLLLNRAEVETIWGTEVSHAPRIRRTPSQQNIRDALRKIYSAPNANPPNVNQAYGLVCQQLGKTPRNLVREILKEPEFARHRSPPGRRMK